MELEIQVKHINGVPVLELIGELDMHTSATLREAVVALLDQGSQQMVINMSSVTYIDSTGLGSVVGLLKHVSDKGAKLYVAFSNSLIERVFKSTGLDTIVHFKKTDEEAIECLRRGDTSAGWTTAETVHRPNLN